LRKTVNKILSELECDDCEISILLVDDCQIREINQRYLNRDRPTDVVAFAMREGDFTEINPELLGDVVISLETAFRQANEGKHSFEDELNHLLIHGILHLLDYNHENCDRLTANLMRQKERELFAVVKKSS